MCLFCKIIAGEIPNYTVYQDDNVLAFLDVHPCAKGHTVVIPKKHHGRLSELSPSEWQAVQVGVQAAQQRLQTVLQPDGFNIGINDGEAGGQKVPHIHWHIFPRYTGDGGGSVHAIIRPQEAIDVAATAKLFA